MPKATAADTAKRKVRQTDLHKKALSDDGLSPDEQSELAQLLQADDYGDPQW